MDPRIPEGVVAVFKEKGIKFTMDDLSRYLGMSKRSIYEQIESKDKLIERMIDMAFDDIRRKQEEIYRSDLSVVDKLKGISSVLPTVFRDMDYKRIHELKAYRPKLYEKVEKHMAEGWALSYQLLEEGRDAGIFRPVNPLLFKEVLHASMDRLLRERFLLENGIGYQEAMDQVVRLIFDGLVIARD